MIDYADYDLSNLVFFYILLRFVSLHASPNAFNIHMLVFNHNTNGLLKVLVPIFILKRGLNPESSFPRSDYSAEITASLRVLG